MREQNISRFNPDINGLTSNEVKDRQLNKLVNKTKIVVGKSYLEIILSDVFSFFNVLLFIIAGLMIWAGFYNGLFFLCVIIPNMIVCLYQDIKARVLMGKLRVVTANKVVAIRNGQEEIIPASNLVLDDVIRLKASDQISADSIVMEGKCFVNESLLTGESHNIEKNVGDVLYSGSYIVSGSALARVDKIGKDSYIETIQSKAKKFRRSPSEILKSLRVLFIIIGVVVISLAALMVTIYATRGGFADVESAKKAIGPISGSMVSMIPAGLYLLTSVALAVGVISLSKRKAQVQDFYSIEMLSRTDVLCVDKTGTITDGNLMAKKVILFNENKKDNLNKIVASLVAATNDDNATARCLKQAFKYDVTFKATAVIPFDSVNKYSAASLEDGYTYILGAPEFINIKNKNEVLKHAEEFTSKGLRVLLIAKANKPITGKTYNELASPVALIVLSDHIKDDAYETFKWFANNGVAIKVISGDNAVAVSEIAKQAGILNAEKFISLEGMSIDEVKAIAEEYTVFGRVSPEQKEAIIMALKEKKHKVAMTGDGVNDILALKRADCSIAMANGAQAARNVSHIVLLDSNFSRLPDVVGQGRRVVNNLQRTCSLFLVKTIMAVTLTAVFTIISLVNKERGYPYPFSTNNMYIWEIITIGISAFFLSLQRNNEKIKGKFIANIAKRAIPGGIMILAAIGAMYFGAFANEMCLAGKGYFYTGISSYGFAVGRGSVTGATAMAVIAFTILSLVVLLEVCIPIDKYRGLVFLGAAILVIGLLVGFYFMQYTNWEFRKILRVDFSSLTGPNYMYIFVVVASLSTIYLTGNYIAKQIANKPRGKK